MNIGVVSSPHFLPFQTKNLRKWQKIFNPILIYAIVIINCFANEVFCGFPFPWKHKVTDPWRPVKEEDFSTLVFGDEIEISFFKSWMELDEDANVKHEDKGTRTII